MPAYNHERYLAAALDSVLMQRTDFDYEIVIGEDCSTDDTRSVALQYAERHPGRIRVLAHDRNLGIWENDQAIIRNCRGEYIAWLEADDYWTSPHKLQKQVDLLDQHPDFTACFHWARPLGVSERPATWQHGPPEPRPFYTLDDLLENGHFVPSCTAVFRSHLVREPLEWTRNTPFLETTYFVKFALNGKIGFLDEEMAVFRYHRDGIYGRATDVQNVQAAIAAHRLLGANLELTSRASYRRGLSRMYRALSRELRREGKVLPAAWARCRAVWPV
jgi:glycosyltransferase involved in cell wall biosynthesis